MTIPEVHEVAMGVITADDFPRGAVTVLYEDIEVNAYGIYIQRAEFAYPDGSRHTCTRQSFRSANAGMHNVTAWMWQSGIDADGHVLHAAPTTYAVVLKRRLPDVNVTPEPPLHNDVVGTCIGSARGQAPMFENVVRAAERMHPGLPAATLFGDGHHRAAAAARAEGYHPTGCDCGTPQGAQQRGMRRDTSLTARCCARCNHVDVLKRLRRDTDTVACFECAPPNGYERLEMRRGRPYTSGETPDADILALLTEVDALKCGRSVETMARAIFRVRMRSEIVRRAELFHTDERVFCIHGNARQKFDDTALTMWLLEHDKRAECEREADLIVKALREMNR